MTKVRHNPAPGPINTKFLQVTNHLPCTGKNIGTLHMAPIPLVPNFGRPYSLKHFQRGKKIKYPDENLRILGNFFPTVSCKNKQVATTHSFPNSPSCIWHCTQKGHFDKGEATSVTASEMVQILLCKNVLFCEPLKWNRKRWEGNKLDFEQVT